MCKRRHFKHGATSPLLGIVGNIFEKFYAEKDRMTGKSKLWQTGLN